MSDLKINFIVIDDSKLDCFIAEKIIQNTGRSAVVKTFQHASEALEYIKSVDNTAGTANTIIFVDIQMPVMNGFEFVEAFEQLSEDVRRRYSIYMLSSTINENDLARVKGFSSVKQFLNKPLTANSLTTVLGNYPS